MSSGWLEITIEEAEVRGERIREATEAGERPISAVLCRVCYGAAWVDEQPPRRLWSTTPVKNCECDPPMVADIREIIHLTTPLSQPELEIPFMASVPRKVD